MLPFGWTLSWRAHRQGEFWFMPAHKSNVWCVWLHRICGDGKVELLIWLAVPIFDVFELSPLWRSVLVLLLLLSSLFCYLRVCMLRVASGFPVLQYSIKIEIHFSCEIEDFVETHLCKLCVILRYIVCSFFLSSPPPDGPSSGTGSNLRVSHPTLGIQIVDYVGHRQGGEENRGFSNVWDAYKTSKVVLTTYDLLISCWDKKVTLFLSHKVDITWTTYHVINWWHKLIYKIVQSLFSTKYSILQLECILFYYKIVWAGRCHFAGKGGGGGEGVREGVLPKRLESGSGHYRLEMCGPSNSHHNIA